LVPLPCRFEVAAAALFGGEMLNLLSPFQDALASSEVSPVIDHPIRPPPSDIEQPNIFSLEALRDSDQLLYQRGPKELSTINPSCNLAEWFHMS